LCTIVSFEFMGNSLNHSAGPIFVGGVGGSGTRVFAQVLQGLGFELGPCLNGALDNLWFTSLFKRPSWVSRQHASRTSDIRAALEMFGRAMTTGLRSRLSKEELRLLESAREDVRLGRAGGGASLTAIDSLVGSQRPEGLRWACKEPNCHIFLEEIAATFDDVRFLLVIRHGLDMAYSRNTQQACNWSGAYSLEPLPTDVSPDPRYLFRYWAKANERALCLGKELLADRFLSVRLEDLCEAPLATIERIAAWACRSATPGALASLAQLPVLPKSTGRYRNEALWNLDPADHRALEIMGYSV
jgi:hypothetical protein